MPAAGQNVCGKGNKISARISRATTPSTSRPGVSGVRSFRGGTDRPARKKTMMAHIISPGQTNNASKNSDHIVKLPMMSPIRRPNMAWAMCPPSSWPTGRRFGRVACPVRVHSQRYDDACRCALAGARPYPCRADGLAGRPRRGDSSRKVRAPQDEVVGNAHPGQPAGSVPQRTDRRRPSGWRQG